MFELHITCTKDIDKLKIDFSDGTTVISEKSKNVNKNCTNKKSKKEDETEEKQEYNWSTYDKPLTLSSGSSNTKFDDIVPDTSNRPVFVDDNLQNLDL